jgi:uncharacterized membrane protein (UPF0182 family)
MADIDEDAPIVATIDETGEVAPVPASELTVVPAATREEPAAEPQVVYVTVPSAPKKKSNRLIGALIAFAASLVYALVLALVFAIVWASITGGADFTLTSSRAFSIPVAFFAVAMIVLALLLNRARWWAWVVGSIAVALVVYFGLAGVLLLLNNVVLETPDTARELFREALLNPLVIISALIAREVAVWAGIVISWRGSKVTTRNIEARAAFDREQAERAAAHQQPSHP